MSVDELDSARSAEAIVWAVWVCFDPGVHMHENVVIRGFVVEEYICHIVRGMSEVVCLACRRELAYCLARSREDGKDEGAFPL